MSGGRIGHPPLYHRRERTEIAQILVVGLSRLPDAYQMHDVQLPTRWSMGAPYVLEAMQLRLNARPQVAILRKQTVEHVFGTLKAWLGTTPLLTKTLPKVRTEISLAVLAYNMKRMIKIVGMQGMLRAIAA